MKICISHFNVDKINFDNYSHLNLVILSSSSHYRVWSWCNKLLLQFYAKLMVKRCIGDVQFPVTRGHYSCLTDIVF